MAGGGLVAGLRVGLGGGVLLLPGFGVSSSSPQIPGHPTSICDVGVNAKLFLHNVINFVHKPGNTAPFLLFRIVNNTYIHSFK